MRGGSDYPDESIKFVRALIETESKPHVLLTTFNNGFPKNLLDIFSILLILEKESLLVEMLKIPGVVNALTTNNILLHDKHGNSVSVYATRRNMPALLEKWAPHEASIETALETARQAREAKRQAERQEEARAQELHQAERLRQKAERLRAQAKALESQAKRRRTEPAAADSVTSPAAGYRASGPLSGTDTDSAASSSSSPRAASTSRLTARRR